jgi:molecular chaperone GrpE
MSADNTSTTDKPQEDARDPNIGDAPANDDAQSAAEDSGADAAAEVDVLAAKLDEAAREIARLRDAHARAVADLENYRRRVAREKEELRKFAEQGLIEDLLPITDNFAIGLEAAGKHPEAAPITEGFKMIATQIKNTLEQHGLRKINPLGEAFDPNAHESVSQTPHAEIPEHHVAAVLRVGYRLHDRLMRPATVVLSTGAADAGAQNGESPAEKESPADASAGG